MNTKVFTPEGKRKNRKFEFVVDEQPEEAGIDPLNKMIDRNPDDNTKSAS